jgi:hypothetical protein
MRHVFSRSDQQGKRLAAIILALIGILGILELALADRKYGLFTGGFGQSQAVDTLAERLLFAAGYLCSITLLIMIMWWIIVRIFRSRASWPPLFFLMTLTGGAYEPPRYCRRLFGLS